MQHSSPRRANQYHDMLMLGNVQRLDSRKEKGAPLRQKVYDTRDAYRAKIEQLIRSAAPDQKAVLRQQLQAEYDRYMTVIRRYNAVFAGMTPNSDSELQHAAAAAAGLLAQYEVDVELDAQQVQPDFVLLPWPPTASVGASIRSTPRRPGAPAGTLPH
jgi:hypothetical protein